MKSIMPTIIGALIGGFIIGAGAIFLHGIAYLTLLIVSLVAVLSLLVWMHWDYLSGN